MSVDDCQTREACSLCQSPALETTSMRLGLTPLANEYVAKNDVGVLQDEFPLYVMICHACGHSQLGCLVDGKRLFRDYKYATATSSLTVEHVQQEARWIKHWCETQAGFELGPDSKVVEIGSNDGTMLSEWKRLGVGHVVGVDPAAKKLALDPGLEGVTLMNDFFTLNSGRSLRADMGPADVIVANNVLAHVPVVVEVVRGVRDLLKDGGVFVFEVSYLMDMAEAPLFDTIYHEHTSYHAVGPLARMLDKLGMPIRFAQRLTNQLGRGSLRVVCTKGGGTSLESTSARQLMMREAKLGMWDHPFWVRLMEDVLVKGNSLKSWIETLRAAGETVVGYGAAAKLTTLMYAFKLGREHLDFVVDDSPWKHGLYTPGLHVPILPANALLEGTPGTCVVFAWNFWKSIVSNNPDYKGRFLLPLPEIREVSLHHPDQRRGIGRGIKR